MLRVFRTALPFACLPLVFATACSTIYRPVYSPGKTNYQKPPEKTDNALLPPTLPPANDSGLGGVVVPTAPDITAPAGGSPPPNAGTPELPAIPGLPQ